MATNDPPADARTARQLARPGRRPVARLRPGSAPRAASSASSTPPSSSMNDNATGKEFTVQEVVERSGQSLRSFYQYFGGKQELLLALFEESVRSTADHLARQGRRRSPTRASGCTRSWSSTTGSAGPPSRKANRKAPARALAEFAQQLLTAQPAEAARPSTRW